MLVGSILAYAMEVSQIMEPKATEPTCGSIEYDMNNPQKIGLPKAKCDSCKQAVQSAVQQATAALSAAKAQDASISASANASTAGTAAAVGLHQAQQQNSTGTVNQQGVNAANQQAGLARQVSSAMKQCSSQIKSACSGLAQEDQQAADASAQSCEQAGQQADAVAAEKSAKASQMAQNGQQANQNAQGLQPPQMPQGSQGGLADSNPTTNPTATLSPTKNNSLQEFKSSSPKIDVTSGKAQEGTNSIPKNVPSSSSGIAAKSENGKGLHAFGANGNKSFSNTSASSSSGGGNFAGGSAATIRDKDGNVMSEAQAAAAASGTGEYSSSGGGGGSKSSFKAGSSLLGIDTNENDLQSISGNGVDDPLKNALDEANQKALAANAKKTADEESLFKRVSGKIREISIARTMQ